MFNRGGTCAGVRASSSGIAATLAATIWCGLPGVGRADCDTGSVEDLVACTWRSHAPASCEAAAGQQTAPVDGMPILRFGEDTQYGTSSRGNVYRASPGQAVRAPVAGVVGFAGDYRSYGPVVVIHGCGDSVVIAGPLADSVALGAVVPMGAPVARVATQGALYVELHRDGRRVAPGFTDLP